MKSRAYGKINLVLNVVGKNSDGYHDLEMVMTSIGLFDTLDISISDEDEFISNCRYLRYDEGNTIYKVIEKLREKYGFTQRFKVDLQKHIPSQAGLAGGSSDAAAAIRIINKLLNLNMSSQQMIDFAYTIGADVPFCLSGKTSLVKGIGEKLLEIENNADFYMILVKPYKGVSTKEAFSILKYDTMPHYECEKMVQALKNNDYEMICQELGNTLEEPSFALVKQISNIKKELIDLGCDGALMSGSGSTVFGISKDYELLRRIQQELRTKYSFVYVTNLIKEI
ncbi:MAG: 4-(cytidine 5'-diphospho)-2-C-methyl-D-erythritol kinase [Erysipelotrichaceae bacterium]